MKDEVPSVGRMVHYRSHGSRDGTYQSVCRSAVMTAADDLLGRHVDLCVFNPTGLFFNKSSHDGELGAGTWHWYWECEEEE